MLKVLVIPSNQQKAADKIIDMFVLLYPVLLKHFNVDNEVLQMLLSVHLESAFKLTQHRVKHIQCRAYAWLATIIENCPQSFLTDMKKRLMKSIFTHSLEVALADDLNKPDSLKLNGLKIAAKFQIPSRLKGREDYYEIITGHFIKAMMESDRDKIRREAVLLINLSE